MCTPCSTSRYLWTGMNESLPAGGGGDFQAAGVAADQHRAVLLDEVLGRVQRDAGRVVLADLGVVVAVVAPVPQRAGADQHHVARLQLRLLPREGRVDVGGRDRVVRRQLGHVAGRGNVEQHAAGDDRRDRRRVALAARRSRRPNRPP